VRPETDWEDREGDIWVATNAGLDRFRDYSVATLSAKQGLSSAVVGSVLADKDGSVWLAAAGSLAGRNNRQIIDCGKRKRGEGSGNGHCEMLLLQETWKRRIQPRPKASLFYVYLQASWDDLRRAL
jgi:hypothetical protein